MAKVDGVSHADQGHIADSPGVTSASLTLSLACSFPSVIVCLLVCLHAYLEADGGLLLRERYHQDRY